MTEMDSQTVTLV